ncbi:MAG: 4Fe-4S dicluster domain-containing protein [Kiloniellales bacterium]
MEQSGRRLLICNCEQSMPLEGGKLTRACQAAGASGELELNTQLCRAQLDNFQAALAGEKPLLVACTQESPLFAEIAAEQQPEADLAFVNIRETAGWSDEAAAATPKIAALLAEAALALPSTPSVTLTSEGQCLVYGRDERALEVAKRLSGRLEVTLLLSEPAEITPPQVMDVPVFAGTVIRASGNLGSFSVTIAGYAPAKPSARRSLAFDDARREAVSRCDLILDMSGGEPLFPAGERRDGYYQVDPDDPIAVERAAFALTDMVGEYEKPRYVKFDATLCAHSRSRKIGCTRCLDVCPTSAIEPAGDTVAIDAQICAGCGNCASVCPTGAATYQLPAANSLYERLRMLLKTYAAAGGRAPLLLLYDQRWGAEMISLIARHGRGLPARVLPFGLNEVTQVGLDFLAAAFAYGADGIAILAGPEKRQELTSLASQIGLTETVLEGLGFGGGRVHLLDQDDPDAVAETLYGLESKAPPTVGDFVPLGGKRARTRLALGALHENAPQPVDFLPLPAGAPFGQVTVRAEGCTLCLACVGACPTGALVDAADRPWLGFKEEACIQCGLCKVTCPEKVISLIPRLNFTATAMEAVKLNEAEPFNCIRCGKPFGVRASIDRIAEQLAGKHSMFQSQDQSERIMMCNDCRVVAQFELGGDPFAGKPRPLVRSTDDYLREREIEEARARLLEERDDKAKPH